MPSVKNSERINNNYSAPPAPPLHILPPKQKQTPTRDNTTTPLQAPHKNTHKHTQTHTKNAKCMKRIRKTSYTNKKSDKLKVTERERVREKRVGTYKEKTS